MGKTSNRSVTLTRDEQDWIEIVAQEKKQSFSGALGLIVRQNKQLRPDIKKQNALKSLRESAVVLWKDLEIPQEVILTWVADVTGGRT